MLKVVLAGLVHINQYRHIYAPYTHIITGPSFDTGGDIFRKAGSGSVGGVGLVQASRQELWPGGLA